MKKKKKICFLPITSVSPETPLITISHAFLFHQPYVTLYSARSEGPMGLAPSPSCPFTKTSSSLMMEAIQQSTNLQLIPEIIISHSFFPAFPKNKIICKYVSSQIRQKSKSHYLKNIWRHPYPCIQDYIA